MLGEGGIVGNVNLGRSSTIIKPVAIPIAAPESHAALSYTVQDGEDLSAVAAKFHVTAAQIRWSNPDLLTKTDKVQAGALLVIPPVPGVVVTAQAGDTVDSLATKYQADAPTIMDYNRLRDTQVPAGTVIVIPDGVGPDFPAPPPPIIWTLVEHPAYFNIVRMPYVLGPYSPGSFPVGWCTYYVATMRHVTWSGNAAEWYNNARAQGYPVGAVPQVGAIMVTWESYLGHVAYVEKVNPDGSWVVNEMNGAYGWNTIDQRTIKPGQIPLIGFIYGS